jgi:phenylpyruvate tautomerase PptA (4-oxalocrotonate tautomerase family)
MACHFEEATMNDKDRVDRLDSAMIKEILGLGDEEVAVLVSEVDIRASQQGLRQAKATLGKLRLARARTAVALHAAGAKPAPSGRRSDGHRVLMLRRADPALDNKMTIAARSGKANAEADAASMDEDLSELDAWEEEDRDRS